MNILIIELETRGHHISSYVRSLVEHLNKSGVKIFLLTSSDIKKNKFYPYLKKNTKVFYVDQIKYPRNKIQFNFIKFQSQYFYLIKNSVEKINNEFKINHIYINTLDFFDKFLAILDTPFKNIEFSALLLHPKFHFSLKMLNYNYVKYFLYNKLMFRILSIKFLKNIYIVDPLCKQYVRKFKSNLNKKIKYIPELGTANIIKNLNFSKKNCRDILNIDHKDFVVLVYGSIRENKCLNELFNGVSLLKNFNITILIAGQQDSYAKKFLIKNKNKVKFKCIDKFIDDKLEKIIFKSSNITWAGYSKLFFGSSGVFFLSCQNKIPVIGSNHGALGWYLKKFKVGYALNLSNSIKVSKILKKIIAGDKIPFEFEKVNKYHNHKVFGSMIAKQILKNY